MDLMWHDPPKIIIITILATLCCHRPAHSQTALRCGPFTSEAVAVPAPPTAHWPLRRLAEINAAVKTQPYKLLFLGDSITERFDPEVWAAHMAPRGVLNAGINGDRTEHLLWRLQHGNVAGPPPQAVVMLIGTDDLAHGRSPENAAEGIRANLLYLRQHLPGTRILLLGLWPRAASPEDPLRRAIVAVNALIQHCGDDDTVVYADIGSVLLDPTGALTREVSPDLLHFSRDGYARLAPILGGLIDRLTSASTSAVSVPAAPTSVAERVQLEQQGGVYVVPVRVNGSLLLPFIIDSGAADVAIPGDVFSTLLRTGTVKPGDFVGRQTYILADGSELPSDQFILRELRVGGHVVRNVTAHVANVKGDPLLGQSFLSKLPTWSIDNEQHALVLHDTAGPLGKH